MKNRMISCLIVSLLVISCKTPEKSRNTQSAYLNFEVQFINEESNGVELYKLFVPGNSKNQSVKQAKLELIKTILFKGVSGSPDPRPIITEVNASEKYKGYFNQFLSDDGPFVNFITLHNGDQINQNDILKTGNRKIMGIELLINKMKLRETLESANIIKKQ